MAPSAELGSAELAPAGAPAAVRRAQARRPWGTRAVVFLVWGLTFHVAAMAFLFGFVRLPMDVVRAIAAWKEVLALALVGAVVVRAAGGHGAGTTPRPADLLAGALVSLAALHAIASWAGWGPTDGPVAVAYGARDLVFFFALYFVGRHAADAATSETAFRQLYAVGAATALVAVLEWAFLTPQMLVVLGVASYFNDFLDAGMLTKGNVYGLPDNYWTMIGGRLVQRAGSVHLSSQGFAVPFLVIVPAATIWMYLRDRWRSPVALLAYATIWAGLLLTITRMTIVACALQVLLIMLLHRRPAPLVALGVTGTVVVAVLLAVVPGLAGYVWETLLWQTASSGSHGDDYARGLAALVRHPLGAGLGTTDATAARLGLEPLTGDNLYLKYAVELGVAGGVAFVAFLAYGLWTGIRGALTLRDEGARLAAALGAALSLGVAVNGVTAVVFNSPLLAYTYFLLAGAVVTVVGDHGDASRAAAS